MILYLHLPGLPTVKQSGRKDSGCSGVSSGWLPVTMPLRASLGSFLTSLWFSWFHEEIKIAYFQI